MGAFILASGISTDKTIRTSVEHAVIAAKRCMAAAKIPVEEVALIINTGIYRENNLIEPAIAMLIQKELGMNGDYVKAANGKDAFGFDLMNGGIGALNAMKVADAFVQSGAIRFALIVGADSHPSGAIREDFPYATLGAAMIIGKNPDPTRGFQGFSFKSEKHEDQGRSAYVDFKNMGVDGRNRMTIKTAPDFYQAALKLAVRTAKSYIDEHGLKPAELRLISSQLDAQFAAILAESLGLAPSPTANIFNQFGGDSHSASFGLGFHCLLESDPNQAGKGILFVGAAAGLDAGVVHYVS